jgi:hypothetical protein
VTTPGQMGPVLYNPALLRREELIGSFVVRHGELQELMDRVRAAPADHAPQHVLILGWRGMGKTTLLHRLGYSVEDDPELRETWLPVLFDEEQLNVGELADFWLNTLEMLSIAAGDPTIKDRADRLSTTLRGRELEEAAYEALAEAARGLGRRLLLLVDNVDLVLSRIDPDRESSRLREILQHEPWLMLLGTSSQAIEATYDYRQTFYEMFRLLELAPLDEERTIAMLSGLAERYNAPDVKRVVVEDPRKIQKLRLLMGGNPRTVGLLFSLLQESAAGDFRSHLERLLDRATSLYKERLENLPVQAQRVFVALALRWDPATAAQIAVDLRIDRGIASGQLHRLVEKGLVEKVKMPRRAIGFQIRERFFNIWWLMRGGRRSQQRLRWLVEAIDLFYDTQRLATETQRVIKRLRLPEGQQDWLKYLEYGAALYHAIPVRAERADLMVALLEAISRLDPSERTLWFDPPELARLQEELRPEDALDIAYGALDAGLADAGVVDSTYQLLRATGRWRDITNLSERVLAVSPDDTKSLCAGAVAGLFTPDMDRARTAVARLLVLAPNEPLTWDLSANINFAAGNSQGSRDAILEGLKIAPNDIALHLTSLALGVSEFDPVVMSEVGRPGVDRPFLPLTALGGVLYLLMVSLIADVSAEMENMLNALAELTKHWPAPYAQLLLSLMVSAGQRSVVIAGLEEGFFEGAITVQDVLSLESTDEGEATGLAPERLTALGPWFAVIREARSTFDRMRSRVAEVKTAT